MADVWRVIELIILFVISVLELLVDGQRQRLHPPLREVAIK